MSEQPSEGTTQLMLLFIAFGVACLLGANGVMLSWVASEAGFPLDMGKDVMLVYLIGVVAVIAALLVPVVRSGAELIQQWRGETA